ncbi:hypothetical protein JB92DRAFT_2847761, partial [Gautieria morchelliformis]
QAIYRALQIIGGHIGLPILLLFSIFSKTAQRDLTFLNFCFTWTFSSITFSVGSIFGLPLPFIRSDQECLNQAALVSGAQAMTDTAMCAFIVQVAVAAIHGPRGPRQIRWTKATVDLICHHLSLALQTDYDLRGLISQYTVLLSILIVTLIFDVPLSVAFRVIIFCAYRLVVAVYVPFPHMLSLYPVSDHLH